MARKKKPEEHENHERWLVSYADFITLLFAFFVVMYSVSSVNEGKYRVLSNSLTSAFGKKAEAISPISLGATPKTSLISAAATNPLVSMNISSPIPSVKSSGDGEGSGASDELDEIAAEISESMKGLVEDDLVKIGIGENGIEVEINTSILFQSGSAYLQRDALPTLKKVAKILKGKQHSINVEGFTDNVPINTEIYRSNWELSAARAASVVHLFARTGVDPQKMSAIGYAEYHPVDTNATEKGRKHNRRVVVVIAPLKTKRETQDDLEKLKKDNIRGKPKEASTKS